MLLSISLFLACIASRASGQISTVHQIKPPIPTVTITDICNMPLITSIEGNEDATQKKCKCNTADMDVDCRHLAITELPKLISFPKGVHIASFKGNEIAVLNPETFYNGRDIIELDLSYNRIDFVSVKSFEAFKNLKVLDLSHNRVWNLPTSCFQGLEGLKRLDLSFNNLINVFPNLFSSLTELRELNLKSNPLEELEPKHFEHLQKLEQLDLESTLLQVIPDHIFVFTPKLKVLNLAGNQLTRVPTEALHVLDHVRVLHLSGNPIEVIKPEAFKGMTGLVMLYLDRMPRLTKIEKYALGDLTHLQEFHSSYNFLLSDISELAFVNKFSNQEVPLAQLFLRQNQLTSIPKHLLEWNDQMELHLKDNPLHCDCNIEWMVNMKLKHDFQSHLRCATPEEYRDKYLFELKGEELTCGLHLSEIVMIACSVVTAFLILALIVAFLLWRRNYVGYSKPYFQVSKRKKCANDIDYRGGDDDDI